MQITWLGTAGFRIESGDTAILIDPYLSRNAAARPPQPVRPADLGPARAVFLSHGHFDHACDLPQVAAHTGARIFCGPGTDRDLAARGLDPARISLVERDGQEFALPGLIARAFFSRHVRFDIPLMFRTLARCGWRLIPAARLSRAYPCGQVLAWRLNLEGKTLLHFGSAGATRAELARLAESPPDLLMTPMQGHTRIYEIAYEQVRALRPAAVVIHHHDDFYPPVSQWIDPAPLAARLVRDFPGLRVILPELNQPFSL